MRQSLILAVSLAMCAPCAAQEASVEKLLAQLEPPIQEQIKKVRAALEHRAQSGNVAASQAIQTLMDSAGDNFEIVKQMAIYAADPAGDEGQPLMATLILHSLDFPPKIVIRVLAPYIDAENPQLRSFVRHWFESHDTCSGSGALALQSLNFQDYVDYVRVQLNMNKDVPTAFIEYLYERSPGRALLVFYHANPQRHAETVARLREMQEELEADRQQLEEEGASETPQQREADREEEIRQKVESELRREVLLAEHTVGNAIWLKENRFGEEFQKALPEATIELAKLAEHDQWWVRLYVAEIMRQHRELRQRAVVQQLASDSNPLVSKAAKSAKQK